MERFPAIVSIALVLMLAACGGGSKSDTSAADNSAAGATNSAAAGAGGAMSGADSMAASPSDVNCGAVKPVWVNLTAKAYHEPGDPYYGKTKHGQYMCPSVAQREGYHPAGGASGGSMSGHHHKKGGSDSSGGDDSQQ
jgi:hypothetical protein